MKPVFYGEALANFYLILAAASTLLFVLKAAAFSFWGSDAELHSDPGGAGVVENDHSFNYLSLQSILAFLMGFAWIGLAGLTQWGLSPAASAALASIAGAVLLFLSAFLMRQAMRLNSRPKQDYEDALNRIGQAYTNFAANGRGRVQIEINGKLTVANAINAGGEVINSFAPIKAIKVENYTLHIKKADIGG